MKYIRQFCVILGISFFGEVLKDVIPLPIPASIYGLILMLGALSKGLIKIDHVKEAGDFLVEIMPVMFIPAAVGILVSYQELKDILIPVLVITAVSTVAVMAVSGAVTQCIIRRDAGKKVQRG